jgi:hypothetical protein
MENIFEHTGKELTWTLVNNIGYVLHVHDSQTDIAVLVVQGAFGSKAEGKCGNSSWKFKRIGILQNGISVQESGSGKQLGVFKKNSFNSNGTLAFAGGKKITVKRNALMTEYDLLQENELLITYRHTQGRPQVFIHSPATNVPDLPLLVVFLGYLVIMQRIDARFNPPY